MYVQVQCKRNMMYYCIRRYIHALPRTYGRVNTVLLSSNVTAHQKCIPLIRCMSTGEQYDSNKRDSKSWLGLRLAGHKRDSKSWLGLGLAGAIGAYAIFKVQSLRRKPIKPEEFKDATDNKRLAAIVATNIASTQSLREELQNTTATEITNETNSDSESMRKNELLKRNESDKDSDTVLPEMPEKVPYLIIGSGTAAFSACEAIRKRNASAKILVIGSEEYLPYRRPPLSKELWFAEDEEDVKNLRFKSWSGKTYTVYHEKDSFYCTPRELLSKDEGGTAIAMGKKVVELIVNKNKVVLSDGTEVKYGKCLLATGGNPKTVPVLHNSTPEVVSKTTVFRTIEDFKKLNSIAQNVESIAIIGGGFLGSELACALGKRGKKNGKLKVHQIFPESGNMGRVLPEYISKWTMEKVKTEGVDVQSGSTVVGCNYNGDVDKVELILNNGSKLEVDHVVCTVGLEPNVELGISSGLEIDPSNGGFLVNSELEARTNVWVAGDAASFYDIKLGRRRVEHFDHAMVSGRLAGQNMTGARKPYHHQSMFWSDLGPDVSYEAIGVVDSSLPTIAVFAKRPQENTDEHVITEMDEDVVHIQASEGATSADIDSTIVSKESRKYDKGVIFYMRDKIVVGVLIWNIQGLLGFARKVIDLQIGEDEIPELSKHIQVHSKS